MEGGPRRFAFFFDGAYERLDTVLKYAQTRFTELFPRDGGSGQVAPEGPPFALIQQGIDKRYEQLISLAGSDPLKIKGYSEMSLIEYYAILNLALAQQVKERSKTG